MKSWKLLHRLQVLAIIFLCLLLGTAAMMDRKDGMLSPDDVILVSTSAFKSDDIYDIIQSNISVINQLFAKDLKPDQISRDALKSYYVDFYLAEVNNGGFAQFVYNSRWNAWINAHIRAGLKDMGAFRHLALFDEASSGVEALEPRELKLFFNRPLFGTNPVRDRLNATTDRFYDLKQVENLYEINFEWLRYHAKLKVLSEESLQEEIDRRANALPWLH